MATRREPSQIIAEILDQDGYSRTEIRMSLGLSSKRMDWFVGVLVSRGLMEESATGRARGKCLNVTPKGKELMAMIQEVADSLGLDTVSW